MSTVPWTLSLDSMDIVHTFHGFHGHCPHIPKIPWTMSIDSMENVQDVHGIYGLSTDGKFTDPINGKALRVDMRQGKSLVFDHQPCTCIVMDT